MHRVITITRIAPKFTPWWALCLMVAIAALGFIWLGLDGGRSIDPRLQERRGLASTETFMPLSYYVTRQEVLDSVPATILDVTNEPNAPEAEQDNLAVLAVSSSGALTLTGLVLLAVRKRRSNPALVAPVINRTASAGR